MPTELTLEDILNDQIEGHHTESPAADDTATTGGATRHYRIRKGDYVMTINSVKIKEDYNERRFATLVGKLENAEGTYRGTVFPDISWQSRDNRNGKLDLKSRLFGNLVFALGAPIGTPLPQFLEGVVDETVRVFVSEYFRVDYSSLLEEDKEDAEDNDYKTMVFINPDKNGDAKAAYYLDGGYKSLGMVLNITSLNSGVDDDISS